MPNDLLASIGYGGYVSLWKLLLFAIGFFGWMPLVNWVYADTQSVRTNSFTWTLAVLCTGFAALVLWLLVPIFFIGLLIYIIAIASVSAAYVIHRNALVSDFEKVLTADHLRNIFAEPNKKIEQASHGIRFITGNKNEVPLPEPKSKELEGFSITCELVNDAIWHRAEQVRFIPQKEDYAITYEIDGVVSKQDPRSCEEFDSFIYYAKQLAGLDVDEKRKPQKGRFTAILENGEKNLWEVVTSGSTAGEQAQIKKASSLTSRKVEDLGLNENQLESIQTLRDIQSGLIIVSGPKKSGVTSTLYTLLGNHDPFLNNINTLEKNPAGELTNTTQFTYSLSDTGTTTYARQLQTILRKGPDIVGVADCEDAQTAKLASAAANDGKVVYVEIDAKNISQAVEKWLKFVGDKKLVSETLAAVLNQRLVRTLCDECRQAYEPNPALFKKFNLPANEMTTFYRPGEIEYDKHGKPIVCDKCQSSGFHGRTGLFESARINDDMRQVIRNAKSIQEIVTAFRRAGMLYMQEQAIKKVTHSITSINEVIRIFSDKS